MSTIERDITSPQIYTQPELLHRNYAWYRQHQPVAWIDQEPYRPYWAVTKHAHLIEVERQHTLFLNEPRLNLLTKSVEAITDATMGKRTAAVRTLLDMDEPDHRKHRNVTQQWFLGPGVARFQDRVQGICHHWVDRMQAMGNECDFSADVANFIPLAVIMSILGLPEEDTQFILTSTQQLFGTNDSELSRPENLGDGGMAVFTDLMAYLAGVVAQRRQHPTDDLASVIANGLVDGAPMAMLETLSYLLVSATAGHETTSSAMAGGLLALLQHPDQLAKAQQRPELWDTTAADEVVRWVTPVRHMMRTATADYVLAGQQIRAGDSLAMFYLSANRDEDVFPDPFRFDVERPAGRHVAFGIGPHFCLGRLLALSEMRYLFKHLLARLDHIDLAGEPKEVASNLVGGLKHLPVRYRFKA